jgi:nitrogen fixation NifU-like protein
MNDNQAQLLDHYHDPRNFRKPNFEFTHTAKLSNLSCGDEIQVWLKVSLDNVIEDICFDGEGCSIAIGAASLLYQEVKGKSINDLKSLNEDYSLSLVGIPLTMTRVKCAVLSLEAIKKALS